MLHKLLQHVPGCWLLQDVLLVPEEADMCIDWLLNINIQYVDVTTEQMCLMLRADSHV